MTTSLIAFFAFHLAADIRRLIVGVSCFVAVGACAKGIDVAEWTEEVRLSDGRTIIVWRTARALSSGFPNARRGSIVDHEFKYQQLGVEWKSTVTDTYVREPVAFDIIDGIPVLVLYAGDRESCRNRPPSDFSAQFLKLSKGGWVDVPQSQFPIDRVPINLYARYWGHGPKDDAKGLITWQFKADRDGFRPNHPDTVRSYFARGSRTCETSLKN